jgi:hypothetical protein
METKPYNLQSPEAIAKDYGGNKRAIAEAAQMGMLDPTTAVLAGMFIDRMRQAQAMEQTPTQTVAQDVMAAAPQMPAGLAATPQAQQMAPQVAAQMGPQMAAPQGQPPAQFADGGLASLYVPDDMYDYAGGGIIAFENGGSTGMFYSEPNETGPMSREDLVNQLTLTELQVYNRTGKLPPRLQSQLEGRRISGMPQLGSMPLTSSYPVFDIPQAPAVAAPATTTPPAAQTAPPVAPTAAPSTAPAAPSVASSLPASLLNAATEITPEQYKQQQKEFGIDNKWIKKIEELQAKMGDTGSEREQAKNMALLQAGLGIMSGTSPYLLQNIGEGAKAAVTQYSKDIKEIKAAERDADKLGVELAKAEDARARGDFEGFQKHNNTARELALKLRKLELDERQVRAQEKTASRPGTYEELGIAAQKYPWLKDRFTSGSGSTDLNRVRYARDALAKDINYLQLSRSKKPEDQRKAREIERKIYAEFGVTPESSLGAGSSDPLGLRGGR